MNKYIKIITFLVKEKLISDSYISVVADILLRQAADNLGKELGYSIDYDLFKKEVFQELKIKE